MAVSSRRRWIYSALCTGLFWLVPPSPFFPFPLAILLPDLLVEAGLPVIGFLGLNLVAVHFCWFRFWGLRWGWGRVGWLVLAVGLCGLPYAVDSWMNWA